MSATPVGHRAIVWDPIAFELPDEYPEIVTSDPMLAVPQLVQQVAYLNRVTLGGGATVRKILPPNAIYASEHFTFDGVTLGAQWKWLQSSVAEQGTLLFALDLPPRGRILKAYFYIRGDAASGVGHSVGGFPEHRPIFRLMRQPFLSAAYETVAEITEPSLSVNAYDLPHAVTFDFDDVTIDGLSNYYLGVKGETGDNAIPSRFALYGIAVEYAGPIL